MPTKKTYKIAKLALLNSDNPTIDYVPAGTEFNTIVEAKANMPNDTQDTIYRIVEFNTMPNGLKEAKLI